MILYVDLLLASNLIVNYLFIKSINIVFKDKTRIIPLILSLFISLISLGLFFISNPLIYNLRYFVGIIIGIVAFWGTKTKEKIVKIIIYYFLNFCFIGTLVIFNVVNEIFLYVSLLVVIIIWIIENYKLFFIKEKQLTYDVIIDKQKLKGFLDTGNQTYIDGIPAVFIKSNFYNEEFTLYKTVEIKGIGSTNNVLVYNGPLLFINNKSYVVFYIFLEDIDKDVILNGELGETE